jgi:L-fuconolactonase
MTRIIDSHHHLWKFNTEDYAWMDDSMEILRKDYTPLELKSEILKAGVEGTVVVQARQKLEETEWLLDMAGKYDFIKGVVGWVDLRLEDLEEQLDAFAAHPKISWSQTCDS